MRFTWVVLTALWLAAAPATAQAPEAAALEIVVRATPAGGRAEPVRRMTLFLLRTSFDEIREDVVRSQPEPDLDAFIETLEVSPELKAWMQRTRRVELAGPEFVRSLTVNDIMDIPEFFAAYLARNAGDTTVGFPRARFREQDRERNRARYERQRQEYFDRLRKTIESYPHTKDQIEIYLTQIPAGQQWAAQQNEHRRRLRLRALERAQTTELVAQTETDLEGRAAFVHVPAGRYWLSTLENEALVGDARLRWDHPVEVRAGQTTRVELTNLNAAGRGR
jgi:hypothetical protein